MTQASQCPSLDSIRAARFHHKTEPQVSGVHAALGIVGQASRGANRGFVRGSNAGAPREFLLRGIPSPGSNPILRPHIVEMADMRVIQRRDGLRFPLKPLLQLRTGGKMRSQNLDRDGTVQARVPGAIHFAHFPCPDESLDLIRPEFGARCEGHPCANYSPEEALYRHPTILDEWSAMRK